MIFFYLQWLQSLGVHVPHVFLYSSTRMILGAIGSLLVSVLWGKVFIKKLYELKIGHTVRVADCAALADQYKKSSDVPSMGGILLLSSTVLSTLLWSDLGNVFTRILLLTTLWMGLIGAVDDYKKIKSKKGHGLSARTKFLLQSIFAVFFALYLFWTPLTESIHKGSHVPPPVAKEKAYDSGEVRRLSTHEYATHYYIPFYKKPIVLTGSLVALGVLFTIFVILGSTNAVNLTDGLDGLASGLVLLVAAVLAIFAFLSSNLAIARYLNILYIEGGGEIAIYLTALMGACLGFLWFNGYPAQVFMGDTGSLALGGVLGVSAVLLRREFLYGLIAAVFVVEALSVIIQVFSYRYFGRRVFHCTPIHHHFEIKGWHESKIVLRFWMVGLIMALIGLASLKLQ